MAADGLVLFRTLIVHGFRYRARKAVVIARRCSCQVVFIFFFVLLSSSNSLSQVACKPFLAIKSVSEIRPSPSALTWRWNAELKADDNHCATQSGTFEIDFVRIKENSPDLQFTSMFRWSQGNFGISMELNSDEAVLQFRIGFIAPCVCRQIDQLSVDYPSKMSPTELPPASNAGN
jgi:hypothetical protein